MQWLGSHGGPGTESVLRRVADVPQVYAAFESHLPLFGSTMRVLGSLELVDGDFDGNLRRIRESIEAAKKLGCRFRLGRQDPPVRGTNDQMRTARCVPRISHDLLCHMPDY